MERSIKLEYQDLSREVRDILPENVNETAPHISYHPTRMIYPDQCWEIDPDRTVLTQYIAHHPAMVKSTFMVGDRVLIDRKLHSIIEIYRGQLGVTSWSATVIWYHLRGDNALSRGPPPTGEWCVMPGDFIAPQAMSTITNGALFNYKVRKPGEMYDLAKEYMEARNRYELVVTTLSELRKNMEDNHGT